MAKYLIEGSYTAEGLRGLAKDKASGRTAAVEAAIGGLGGKLECIYYAFGENDVYLICEFPDNATAAAIGLAVGASGMVRTKTTVLLSVGEVDAALAKTVAYRAPGA
ncbi:MAG TPA: GYD domain-containing protein [Verrucomicrobiae bacterium]|nr:GYD domain-containing protein [Verrucomicrobiae bacterium]